MTLKGEVRDFEIKTKRYFLCPECGEHEFQIEHLFDQAERDYRYDTAPSSFTWPCNECGAVICLTINAITGSVRGMVKASERYVRESAIVELVPQSEPIYFVVETFHTIQPKPCCNKDSGKPDTDEQIDSHAEYLYHEHQCPMNVIGQAVSLLVGRDDDAHGIFKFIRRIPRLPHRVVGMTGDDARFIDEHAPGLLPPPPPELED